MSSTKLMSGLKTIKRDFTSNAVAAPSSSQTPSTNVNPGAKKSLNGIEQRLKDIQDALNGQLVQGERMTMKGAAGQKRSSPNEYEDSAAKRRQLPSSWNDAPSHTSSQTRASQGSRNLSRPSTSVIPTSTIAVGPPTNPSRDKPAPVFLSQEQTHILKLVENGESIFYTGSAGTGKSVLLREIIKVLKKKHARSADSVAITASTGIAACNIGGVTIHSFAGIGIGVDSAEHLAQKVRKNKKAMARWLRTKVIIIDEVSMVDGDLYDKLARVGSILRKDTKPFGGIQVIVTGDFFQLPPVNRDPRAVKFAFEAELWGQTIKKTFNLTKVFRQKDPEFVDMLNEMRFGRLTTASIMKFKKLARPLQYDDGVGATELFPRREDVERSNGSRMQHIKAEEQIYKAYDSGSIADTEQGQKVLTNFMASERLILKSARSMGTIVEFTEPQNFMTNPDDPYTVSPASATTKPTSASASGSKGSTAAPARGASLVQKWPVVEFIVRQGQNTGKRRMLVQPESWKVELPNGEVQVARTQLPLILAWAMSIHKSQGQTLDRVKVDLAKVFEKGQAYVALSRATCLEGLQVLNFDATKVNAHPKVVQWSKTLETIPV
ncbi:hypothetical protein EW026_g3138 [Hermanssonia centrifuga]|uniref:ATP-dependent DNA helicase PIF1 n=1 Tax=Hermanssonia centrifuga TaxID=98765 RepID=A0A4S4KLM9_9APHY|nr:hypothetical protein EW026_g3138 [Hermanssonia centrifuga]